MKDTKLRSLVKAVIWRIGAMLVLFPIAFAVTGNIQQSATIVATTELIKIGLYYTYERIWNRIKWGRSK